MQNKLQSIKISSMIAIFFVFSACTIIDKVPSISLRSQGADFDLAKKIDLSVNLCITEEFKATKWEKKNIDTFISPIGNELAKNASELSEILFRQVIISSDSKVINSNSGAIIDAVLTPKVVAIEKSRGATVWGVSIYSVSLQWKLEDVNGNLVWIETINGEAHTPSNYSYTEEQIRMLFKDLFSKSFVAIRDSPEISQFIIRKFGQRPNLEYKPDDPKGAGTLPYGSQPSSDQGAGESSSSSFASPSNQSSEPLSKLEVSNKPSVMPRNALAILPINASKNFHGVGAQYYTTTKVAVIDKLKKLSSNNQEFKYIYNYYDLEENSSHSKLSSEMITEDSINTLWVRKSTFSDSRELNTDFAIDIGKKFKVDLVFTCDLFGDSIKVILIDVATKKVYQKNYFFQIFGGYTAAPKGVDDFFDKYKSNLLK